MFLCNVAIVSASWGVRAPRGTLHAIWCKNRLGISSDNIYVHISKDIMLLGVAVK